MKKFLGIIVIAAVAAAAGWNFSQNNNKEDFANLALANIESIAACEISSSPNENKGYCVKEYNGSKDVCTSNGPYGAPKCNGTIN